MKLFTKIALGIAGFFASVAVICMIIAFGMGFTLNDFRDMVYAGKFTFEFGDNMNIHLFDEDDYFDETGIWNSDTHSEEVQDSSDAQKRQHDVMHSCKKIYIEYGAGKLDIQYADVSYVQIMPENVEKFKFTTSDVEESVHISGGLDVSDNSNASLTILLPRGTQLDKLDLEIGASQANLDGIIADEVSITVGAGDANLLNLTAGYLDLKVGAGSAKVTGLCVKNLDVEAGVGEVDIEIAGAESDYNYSVECGIGEVNVGNHTYGGVGAEQNITNPGAQHQVDIECGIGEVNMRFTGCNVNDGTCENESHNHHSNTH